MQNSKTNFLLYEVIFWVSLKLTLSLLIFPGPSFLLISLALHSSSVLCPVNSEYSFLFTYSTFLSPILSQVSSQSDSSCLTSTSRKPPPTPIPHPHTRPVLLSLAVLGPTGICIPTYPDYCGYRGLFWMQTASQPSRNLYQKSIT